MTLLLPDGERLTAARNGPRARKSAIAPPSPPVQVTTCAAGASTAELSVEKLLGEERSSTAAPATEALPAIIDPFSRLGDEVAGETADEIALNVLRVVQLSMRLRAILVHTPPDLGALFERHTLSSEARDAVRRAAAILAGISRGSRAP